MKHIKRSIAALFALAVLLCGFISDAREMKFGRFETNRVGVGLGAEFPGAKGRVSYTNGAARLDFDFSKGGHYVTFVLGKVQAGAEKISGVFSNDSPVDIRVRLMVHDAKGDTYACGGLIKAGEWDRNMAFAFRHLAWCWGKSKGRDDRAHLKAPFNIEILCEPVKRGLCGAVIAKDLRLVTTAAPDVEPDWCFTDSSVRGGAVFYAGESVEIRYAIHNLRMDRGVAYVRPDRAVVSDWRGDEVYTMKLPESEGLLALSFNNLKGFGAFKVRFLGIDEAGREVGLGQAWFAYLTGRSKPTAWCGTGVHGYGDFDKYEQIARCGIGIVRNDYCWPDCEKSKGVYTPVRAVRKTVAKLRSLGVIPHMIFNGTNRLYENPVDHEGFSNFIRWALQNDLKDVDTFEIWNESWNNYFGRKFGPYDKREWIYRYVAFSKNAAKTVHEERPDANVMVAAEDGLRGLQWMIEDGIAGPEDILSFHPYVHKKDPRPERLHFFYDDEGEMLRAYGKLKGVTRFRSTEFGWTTYSLNSDGSHEHWFVGDYPSVSYAEQANYIIRAYLISRGSGLEAAMQYDFTDDGPRRSYTEDNFGLTFQNLTPKPSFAAVAFMTRLLGEAKPILGSCGENYKIDRQYAFVLPDGRKAYAMWAVENEIERPVPADVRGGIAYDLMGNQIELSDSGKVILTESPIYLVAPQSSTKENILANGVCVNGKNVAEAEWRHETDGDAVRYRLPQGKRVITSEDTVWTMPEDAKCWYQVGIEAYEMAYSSSCVRDVPKGKVLALPITFKLSDGSYRLITEANLVDYTDLAVVYEGAGRFRAVYHAERGPFEQTGVDATPWRVMIKAKNLNELYNCDLVRRLCPEPMNEKSQALYKPGRCIWQWLPAGDPVYAEQKDWYDKTAALGFEYYLIDDGWKNWRNGEKDQWACLKSAINYGKSVGVKTAMWVDSKEMPTAAKRRAYLKKVVEAGAVGIKIDFMPPCDSKWCKWYEETLADTAELGLFVDFHGAVKPTGREKTWPHELAREAIRGHEWHMTRFNRVLPPEHDTILPFCRLVQGHADYTPVVFQKDQLIHFTWPRQMAQGVVMSAPFLCLGDYPQNYLDSPMVEIVKALPATYDETIVLPGSEIGECVALARRAGSRWFIAVENGMAEMKLDIPLSFLPLGKWNLTGFSDDPTGKLDACVREDLEVDLGKRKMLTVRPCGGYVALLTKE